MKDLDWLPGVAEKLGFYVYLLIDPRSDRPFYVGKGTGRRCFTHITTARRTKAKSIGDYEKLATIRAIEGSGRRVRIDVLRHGMDEATAFAVESAAIELLRITGLKNRVEGHHSQRMTVDDANALHGAKTKEVRHRVVLIRIARKFRSGMTDDELYEATRKWWRISRRRRDLQDHRAPRWALAVSDGVVRAVYKIEKWEQPSAAAVRDDPRRTGRWGFVGARDASMETKYLFTDVTKWLLQSAQNPLTYLPRKGVTTHRRVRQASRRFA